LKGYHTPLYVSRTVAFPVLKPTKSTSASLRRSINAHKLLRCGLNSAQLTVDQERTRAADLVHEYFEALPLGDDLQNLELQPADDLAILAAQVYVNMFTLDKAVAHLYNAVVLLEHASRKSPQSYQIRLELVRIYRLLGVCNTLHPRSHFNRSLVRRTAASPGPLSPFKRETDPNRYFIVPSPFSRDQFLIGRYR
jgi:N-acetyltransferase B complex (NatB) non catalytic subunit